MALQSDIELYCHNAYYKLGYMFWLRLQDNNRILNIHVQSKNWHNVVCSLHHIAYVYVYCDMEDVTVNLFYYKVY